MPASAGLSNMFHTFQGAPPRQILSDQSQISSKPANGVGKRVTTPHACAECKRRKIRCDGRQPCGQCLGCRSPKPCYYDKHRQRVIPSRKTLDALSQSLEECRSILKQLYPNQDIQALLPLSRPELISLLDRSDTRGIPSQTSPIGTNTSPLSHGVHSPDGSTPDDDRRLPNLEQVPSQDTEWDEERRNRDPIPAEADDVNALSLSVDRQSSYLSATSIKAVFIVMLKVAPGLRSYLALPNGANIKQVNLGTNNPTPQAASSAKIQLAIPWSSEGQTLIDAYFNRVQILVPMLDEPSFRADYLSGRRQDAPWLALLNMVFAMGSIVARKSDDHSHLGFYNRAKDQLPIDSFGSGHLETLQALALMGGFYLHYLNRPNMANAISGAALRMACAMGLHRESVTSQHGVDQVVVEQRRRTWWSLFCLDTWASTTLGRPTLGRWGPAITIRPPAVSHDPDVIGEHTGILPLIENIKFAKIATQIQDILAQAPLLRTEVRANLDGQLVAWHENLPWILRSTEPCADSVYTARCVLKWRYLDLRTVLHRPVLLNLAYRGNEGPPSEENLAAVRTCRALARKTIEDIAREWTPNQMLGWNGVWFMYQASMIPLVSLFWESWNTELVRDCQSQIETVLEAFEGMADWSLAARRSREVVSKLYEASKRPLTRQGSPKLGNNVVNDPNGVHTHGMGTVNATGHFQQTGDPEMHQVEMVYERMESIDQQSIWDFDGMLWGKLTDGLEMPFDGMPKLGFDDGVVSELYEEAYMMHQ